MNSTNDTFPFTDQLPYKLIETGGEGKKPLIIYLHGYKQNIHLFEDKVSDLFSFKAHHLLLQGPYPIYNENRKHEVKDWGRGWYLYDGVQQQFRKSMEKSCVFIQKAIEKVQSEICNSTVTVFGYSMGAYLGGYFALSRPELVDNLIVIGGRIKTEWFTGSNYEKLKVLALYGTKDTAVVLPDVKKSCKDLEKMGASVTFKTLDQKHRLNDEYIEQVREWMREDDFNKV